jgi:hypothetical protein
VSITQHREASSKDDGKRQIIDMSSHHAPDPDFEWPSAYVNIVPRLSGSLSAVSSATIIYLIFRSQTRLSSIYHQIMLCMSILDITSTIAMALTTIPMPREMPQEKELGFEWPGGRYGNHATCAAQGFFTLSGSIAMFGFNAMLCLYYACAVAFQMKEKNIRKYILPIIYGVPLVSGFGFAITLLFAGSYNPPTDFMLGYWCVGTVYPAGCTGKDDSCIRGNYDVIQKARIVMSFVIVLGMLIMVTSLVLVVNSRFRVHRLTQKIVKAAEKDGASTRILMASSPKDKLERVQKDTNAILLQSVAYIVAFMSGIIWVLLSGDGREMNMTTFKFGLFFVPIQGFLNLIVFLSHKVHNYKRIHRHSTACEVVKLLFVDQVQEPCFVSRISMVIDDDVQGRIDDRLKTGLPFFRIMNEMDVEEYAPDAAMEDIDEIRGSGDQNKIIQDPENDQSESFVDDQQVSINVSKNRDGISSMSSSFQISGSSTLDANDENYGINRKSNMEAMNAMKTRNPADSKTQGPDVIDDVSRGGMSGLSGFSSILRSASASFTTIVTPGTEAGENDTK